MGLKKAEQQQQEYVEKQIREAQEGEYPEHKDISQAENGSMVNDMEDLKQLGEDMDEMSTGSEDRKQGMVSDPEQ
ncbi:hypothetical protein DFP94_11933 [Fontibacillus phaseoli]|uniref:Uncharacterized protein n=1 Tax=Fontibacillus phaseoli TaxID=1416533 RepID=A0A369AX04_9BACL|nr:hypothetical protein [Fontibacillus phaseoli]RCX13922.1 hypothetical protein DFP94_11933 [Fontibacillus phaseoli]